jgi:hypothetical protein
VGHVLGARRINSAEAAPVLTRAVVCCVLQIIDAIYEHDPNGATLAFADMMKKQIVMPAHLMDDGHHETTNKGRNLFAVSHMCAVTHAWCLYCALHLFAVPCSG